MPLRVKEPLRTEGYNQVEIDHLFQFLVLPKFSNGLPVYEASVPELNTVQQLLRTCYKRRFISYAIDISHLLKKKNRQVNLQEVVDRLHFKYTVDRLYSR